jgi:hypothetical protein
VVQFEGGVFEKSEREVQCWFFEMVVEATNGNSPP